MNKKLIAIAVAGTFMAPAISMADGHASWYGRINTGISIKDAEDTTVDIKNISSRFGVKGSEDLGNGLSAVYRYEFGVASDVADIQDNNRLSFVGLSGSFGTVTMGRVWSALFNHVGTMMDVSQNIGGDAYTGGGGTYRTSNTLSYSGGSGPISLQIDLELDGANAASDGADSWAIGGTYSAGSLSIAAGHRNVSGAVDDTDVTGIAARFNMEGMWVGAGYISSDDGSPDNTTGAALLAGGKSGNLSWYLTLESTEDDDDGTDSDAVNMSVVNSLSKGTRVWAELALNDDAAGDTNELILGVRKDF